jgi:hypothetical protein
LLADGVGRLLGLLGLLLLFAQRTLILLENDVTGLEVPVVVLVTVVLLLQFLLGVEHLARKVVEGLFDAGEFP